MTSQTSCGNPLTSAKGELHRVRRASTATSGPERQLLISLVTQHPVCACNPPRRNRSNVLIVAEIHKYVHQIIAQASLHGFCCRENNHVVETYSNLQEWEIVFRADPTEYEQPVCRVSLSAAPGSVLIFEDELRALDPGEIPSNDTKIPIEVEFVVSSLNDVPDMLAVSADLANIFGNQLTFDVLAETHYEIMEEVPKTTLKVSLNLLFPLGDIWLGWALPDYLWKTFKSVNDYLGRNCAPRGLLAAHTNRRI